MQVFTFKYLQILSFWLCKFHIQSPSSIRVPKYTTESGEKVQTTVAFDTRAVTLYFTGPRRGFATPRTS